MKTKIRETFRPFIIFVTVCICGLWIFYREQIAGMLDETALSLFGKNLTGRNVLIRGTIFGGLFLISILLPLLFDRFLCRGRKHGRIADVLTMLPLAGPALYFGSICAEQVIRRDDYWEIADARAFGFPNSMIVEVRRYNGRFLSWGIRSLYAVLDPLPFIRILLIADLVLLTAAFSLLIRQLLKSPGKNGSHPGIWLQSVVTAFVIAAGSVLLASNIWEVWFWGSGMLVYGLGISLCVLGTALVLRVAADDTKRGRELVFPALICFLGCGCSELCTASLIAFLFVILIWKRCVSKVWDKRLIFFLAEVCLTCLLIFLLSGSLNSAGDRAHVSGEDTGGVISGLLGSLPGKFNWAFTVLWGFTFINYRLWLLFIGLFLLIGSQLELDSRIRKRFVLIALILLVTAHAVLFINAVLDYMPPRVATIGICWVILAAVLLCFAGGSFLPGKLNGQPDRLKLVFAAFVLCLTAGHFYHQNIGELQTVKGSWVIRDIVLRQQAGSTETVETCSLPNPGSFRDDIQPDPEDAFNIGTARYYDVPGIFAENRCPPYGESFTDFPPR